MNHMGTCRIETDRLILRRFRMEDAAAMQRNWAGDETVTTYLTWPVHESVAVSEQVIGFWMAGYEEPSRYEWAIELKELGEVIGSMGAVNLREAVSAVEVGYCMGRAWWGRGIAAEALGAVVRFFFEEVGANRVEAKHDPRNPNSGKVMQKCGLRYEGTLRQSGLNNQGICDTAVYAILAEEYGAGR